MSNNISEFIDLIKPHVTKYVDEQNKKVLPSVIIALAIDKVKDLTDDDIKILTDANNFFCVRANKKYTDPLEVAGVKYKKFESPVDAIETFYKSLTGLVGIVSVDVAINKLSLPESAKNNIAEIINSYNLSELDTEVVATIVESQSVEVNENPVVESLKTPLDGNTVEKETVETKEVEVKVEEKKPITTANPVNRKLVPGDKIRLVKTNLYPTPTAGSPSRIVDGYYFIYNEKMSNGRYAITARPENINNKAYLIGYVKKESICR